MLIFLHAVLCAALGGVASNPTVYDQRQSGKTNVRLELKDAIIIAVGDGEFGGDYDYSYDYSDLTIKPGQPIIPTKEPATTAAAPIKPTTVETSTLFSPATNSSTSQNGGLVLEAENHTIIFPSNKPGNLTVEPVKIPTLSSHKPDQIPVIVLQEVLGNRPNKFLPIKTVEKQYVSSSQIRGKGANGTKINPEELPARHCSPGFFLDNHNRCKRIRRPTRERPQLP